MFHKYIPLFNYDYKQQLYPLKLRAYLPPGAVFARISAFPKPVWDKQSGKETGIHSQVGFDQRNQGIFDLFLSSPAIFFPISGGKIVPHQRR